VIHDWRKFKLESEDHESIPPNKRELLRQMSNPKSNNDDTHGKIGRKVVKKPLLISTQHNQEIILIPRIQYTWLLIL